MGGLLYTIVALLVAFWIAGLLFHIGGGLIHIVIVIAVVLFIYNIITGRGARV